MKILFVSSEAVPYSKSGGLADVSGILPGKIAESEEATLILPWYESGSTEDQEAKELFSYSVKMGRKELIAEAYSIKRSSSFRVILIRQDLFFARKFIYGSSESEYHDNFFRFLFFQKAVIGFIETEKTKYDIIHVNDWQSALIPLYIKLNKSSLFKKTSTLLSIHNMGYQGTFEHYYFKEMGLPGYYFTPEKLEFYGNINFLKGGIIYSDSIVTVSPTYAEEILHPDFSEGLEGVLKKYSGKISGILNGTDYNTWDPLKDNLIYEKYSINSIEKKEKNKTRLIKEYKAGFDPSHPLVVSVTRLAYQKGIDRIIKAVKELKNKDISFIILGTGEDQYVKKLKNLEKKHPRFRFFNIFDEKLSHRLFAAGDIFLMPSRYEPCGLAQMYALKYGTVPIVTSTGGLNDTVRNVSGDKGTGFKLNPDKDENLSVLIKKAASYYKDKKNWNKIRARGMKMDFSWKKPVAEYLKTYKELIKRRNK
ncbi:MAG: glycogen/starch synthase [Acidobacteriota bacterium]